MARAASSSKKRDRWESVLHEGGVTLKGLSAIAKKLGEPIGRKTLALANQTLFSKVAVREEIECVGDRQSFAWDLADPNLLLQELVSASPALQEVVAEAARNHPCSLESPWRVLIAFDEFTPGNKFKAANARKVMCFSFTVMEFGLHSICHELCWITSACIRTTKIKITRGGWSRLLRILLHQLMLSNLAMARVGVPMMLHGQAFTLFARVTAGLSDLDGIRMAADWRGAGSLRPCWICENLWKKG